MEVSTEFRTLEEFGTPGSADGPVEGASASASALRLGGRLVPENDDGAGQRGAGKLVKIMMAHLLAIGVLFTTIYFDNPIGRAIRREMALGDISPDQGGGLLGWTAMAGMLGLAIGFSLWLWRAMTQPPDGRGP